MYTRWHTLALGVLALAATAACSSSTPSSSPGPASASGTAAESSAIAQGTTTRAPAATTSPAATSSAATGGSPEDDASPTDSDVPPPVAPAPEAVDVDVDATAALFVTYAGWNAAAQAVEMDGYVAGTVETGGTCTLTLTRGTTSVTTSVAATPDAQTVSCGGAAIPGEELSSGTWTAVLTYESAETTAGSDVTSVVIP